MSRTTAIAIGTVVSLAIAFVVLRPFGGVYVTVLNSGSMAMSDTMIHVAGKTYELGRLESGQQLSVRVRPRGESHVEISYKNESGSQKRVQADCYFEANNYSGTIAVEIANDLLIGVEDTVRISPIL